MKCAHCGKEIEDKFYLLRGDIYCTDCIREDTLKVYYLGNMEEIFYEGDVELYDNKDPFKDYIQQKIESIEERLSMLKITKDKNDDDSKIDDMLIEVYEMNLKEYKDIYEKLK